MCFRKFLRLMVVDTLAAAWKFGAIAGIPLSYQWGHAAEPPLVKVAPASPEMMQLLRDEHGLARDMLKVQNARVY
jgi:hypothetical protein